MPCIPTAAISSITQLPESYLAFLQQLSRHQSNYLSSLFLCKTSALPFKHYTNFRLPI
jgi:hypothetical protein